MAPIINLYTSGTPNGQKISCLLHELDISYNLHAVGLSSNQQKESWFLDINPNGRIPAIVDKTDGANRRVFESGAIMLYLCERYDSKEKLSFSRDSEHYWEMVQWLFWMNAGLGKFEALHCWQMR